MGLGYIPGLICVVCSVQFTSHGPSNLNLGFQRAEKVHLTRPTNFSFVVHKSLMSNKYTYVYIPEDEKLVFGYITEKDIRPPPPDSRLGIWCLLLCICVVCVALLYGLVRYNVGFLSPLSVLYKCCSMVGAIWQVIIWWESYGRAIWQVMIW